MPLIRKLDKDLWEVRSNLDNRIARTLFTVEGDLMVVLGSGGCGNSNKPLKFSEIYSMSTDTWRKVSPMLEARSNHGSC